MRTLVVFAIIGLAVWYFTIGIRIGLIGEWPTQIFNGNGTASYVEEIVFRTYPVDVTGSCSTQSGKATISITNQQGQVLSSVQCTKGMTVVNMRIRPGIGKYPVLIKLEKYFGTLNIR
jgi:hypothetical protein